METVAATSGVLSPPAAKVISRALTTFSPFPHLPASLRIKIWSIFNHQTRIVMCEHYHDQFCKNTRPPKHPATFSVNFESREEAKKAFSFIFEPRLGHPIAFNYATDTLFLANRDVTWYFRGPKYQRYDVDHKAPVQSLALALGHQPQIDCSSGNFEFDAQDIHEIFQVAKYFPSIQELFIVADEETKDMKPAEECLTSMIYHELREERRNCCILHDIECQCTIWTLPNVRFRTLAQMKKELRAEIFNINQGRQRYLRPVVRNASCIFDEAMINMLVVLALLSCCPVVFKGVCRLLASS